MPGAQVIPRPSDWQVGPSAPWADGAAPSLDALVQAVPAHESPLLPAFPNSRPAAVLIVLVDGEHGPEVLLTRRSWDLRHHRGEISFPGGRLDPGETPTEAALREADEEVGLDPVLVDVRGELTHLNTVVSRSYIVPKVGVLAAKPDLVPASMEVDRILWLPLALLTAPGTYHSEIWGVAPLDRELHFFELDDETIWGVTANMLVDLLGRVLAPGRR